MKNIQETLQSCERFKEKRVHFIISDIYYFLTVKNMQYAEISHYDPKGVYFEFRCMTYAYRYICKYIKYSLIYVGLNPPPFVVFFPTLWV